jgi:hypothetical protein
MLDTQLISAPINHLENLMTQMAESAPAIRRAAADRYIEQREKLGRSEQYAALSALKLISNIEAGYLKTL